jgi:hypothetical protein
MAPAYSRIIPSPDFSSEDELPRPRLASNAAWDPSLLVNRSGLAGYDADGRIPLNSAHEDYLSRRSGSSRPPAAHYGFHSTPVDEDRRSRSHISIFSDSDSNAENRRPRSHISISSEDPNPNQETELARLRDEVNRLKSERMLLRRLTEVA